MRQIVGASVAMLLGVAQAGYAADLPTTKPPAAQPAVQCWGSLADFLNTTAQQCPLSLYGITFYGTIDLGVGYQTHSGAFNRDYSVGVDYMVGKAGGRSLWLLSPDGLSTSNVGVKVAEPLGPGWTFVGNLQMGFDPYSFRIANGPLSLIDNNGVPLQDQNSNGDSSRAGQWYNGLGYAGLSSTTFGTVTVGRQNSLLLDNILAYDPTGGSNAFSLIGYSGTWGGGGVTEDARYTTSVKYRENYGPVHFAAQYQFGGYEDGNGSQTALQFDGGFDYGKFSFDAAYSKVNGAVAASALSAPVPAPAVGTLKATISDNTTWMFAGKYDFGQIKLYGGYENIYFAPPSDPVAAPFIGVGGYTFSSANNAAYAINNKVLQVFWTGVKYSVRDNLDLMGAFYYEIQNDYSGKNCSNASASACYGTEPVVSAVVDWRPYSRVEVYAGVAYSKVNGGLANGFLPKATSNADPMVGLRVSF
jgi:predicted porin